MKKQTAVCCALVMFLAYCPVTFPASGAIAKHTGANWAATEKCPGIH